MEKIIALTLFTLLFQIQERNSATILPGVNVASLEFTPKIIDGHYGNGIGPTNFLFSKEQTTNASIYMYAPTAENFTIELNSDYYLNSINLRLYDYDTRDYFYTIYVSADNIDWSMAINRNERPSRSWQYLTFKPKIVKFIRINGKSSTGNDVIIIKFETYYFDSINC